MVIEAQTSTVAVIGLGNLGGPITRALLDAGWRVTVSDRNQDRVLPLLEHGALAPAANSQPADVVLLVVPDDGAVRAVLEGEEGLLARGGVRTAVIVHSTLLPETAEHLARLCADHDVSFVDAPVSGGAARARAGDLTVMVGAQAAALQDVGAVLETVGSRVLHVGPPGAAAATKLANQIMMLSALAGVYEAVDLAGAYGVDAETVLDAVATGTGASWVSQNWDFFPETARAYTEAGTPVRDRPWVKDLHEAVLAARARDVTVPVSALLAQTIGERIEREARK